MVSGAKLKCLTFTLSDENHWKSALCWKMTSCKLFLVRLIWYEYTGWTGNRQDQNKAVHSRMHTELRKEKNDVDRGRNVKKEKILFIKAFTYRY